MNSKLNREDKLKQLISMVQNINKITSRKKIVTKNFKMELETFIQKIDKILNNIFYFMLYD